MHHSSTIHKKPRLSINIETGLFICSRIVLQIKVNGDDLVVGDVDPSLVPEPDPEV